MIKTRICIPVMGKTTAEFIENLNESQALSNVVELRVDSIVHFIFEDLLKIKKALKVNALFTCRRGDEGGITKISEDKRLQIFKIADTLGFPFIDIELATFKENSTLLKGFKTPIICSIHNFIRTPSVGELDTLLQQAWMYPVQMVKIATFVHSYTDIEVLFSYMSRQDKKTPIIIVGMGELGRITRVIGPLVGSYLTYASNHGASSAPGQMDINEIKRYYQLLGPLYGR